MNSNSIDISMELNAKLLPNMGGPLSNPEKYRLIAFNIFDVFKIKLELLYRWEVNRILTIKLQW